MSKEPLGQARIVDSAWSLADAEGLEAVTMRRLGSLLGVEAMSLYHYFPNKEALVDALVDAWYEQVEVPSASSWREALLARCQSFRQALRNHPWAIGLVGTRVHPGPATLAHQEAILRCLREAGLDWPRVARVVAVVDAYVLGFCLQERALPLTSPEQTAAVADSLLTPSFASAFPHLAGFIREHALRPEYSFGAGFDDGLRAVLEGVAS